MDERQLSPATVARFLRNRYESVTDVEPLKGGMWSTAFGFESSGGPGVVRFGRHIEDYEKDAFAAGWTRPGLPIPAVHEIGEAFDGVFAVSERRYGDKLDELPPDRIGPAIEHLIDALIEMHDITLPGAGHGMWAAPTGNAPHRSWRHHLTAVPDRDDDRLAGWRARLADHPDAHRVFERAQTKLQELVDDCPDRRRLVHGDLLAGNVLVSSDDRITAVFDWGNALAGDPLYDLAWLMFWAPWHPGIDPRHLRRAAERIDTVALDQRLACCQVHIALDGMQYQAFAGGEHLDATAAHTTHLLDRL